MPSSEPAAQREPERRSVPEPPSGGWPAHAWMDGRLVAWERCVLHGRSQGAFWGANVFEGIRGYWVPSAGTVSLFRLDDHLLRLRRSMHAVRMGIGYSDADLRAACAEVVAANGFREDVHVVITAYFGMGPGGDTLGLTDDTGVYVTALPRPRTRGYADGIAATVASWRRIGDDTMPPRIKTGANYHNSRLAHQEAVRNGYDTALILNHRGTLAESPSACVLVVRDGCLLTPPATSGALEGITLATVTGLGVHTLGMPFTAREIDRTELYAADEVMLVGTLAEVLPVVSVDRLPVGAGVPGPVTRRLQASYEDLVRRAAPAQPAPIPAPIPAHAGRQ